ncbi:MAG TPA: transglutaminaseTgpA domain-containing protein [Cellulomonas sp.]
MSTPTATAATVPGTHRAPAPGAGPGAADGGRRPRATRRSSSDPHGPARPVGRVAVDVLVLAVAVGAALTPLLPVYGGTILLLPVLGGVLLGAAVAAVSAWRRWSALTTTVLLLLVVVVAGGPLAAPGRTIAGVVPTPGSVVDVVRGAARGWKDVLTLQPPLGGSGWLLVPPYLLALVGTTVAVRVALGRGRGAPAAALVPPVVLAGAVLLGTFQTVRPAVVGTGLALVLLVWASWRSGRLRPRRPVALVVLAAVALGAGLGTAPLVADHRGRYVLRDALVPPFDPRAYPSPLSAFRAFVKDDDTRELFTVTGLPEGTRIRLATFDRFDGVVWNVAGDGSSRASGEFRRVGETVSTEAVDEAAAVDASGSGGTHVDVQVEVDDLDGVWLPTVGDAVAISIDDPGAASELRFNDATGAAVLTGGLTAGTRYTLDAVVPEEPADDQVAGAAGSELDLPEAEGVPDAVASAAADAARDAETPVQVARALEQTLAEGGYFSHGLTDLGDYPSLSGHGADRMTSLLAGDLMVGDDEQYASAMALMAREMGLPSRVVLGFVPGDTDAAAGDGSAGSGATDAVDPDAPVVVTGADVRAWVEISFVGYGWVTFDPTPPQTQTPQEETDTSPADPEPQVAQPPPPPADPVVPPEDDSEQPQTREGDDQAATPVWVRVAVGVAAGSGLVLLLLAPFLVIAGLKARRRRRRRRDVQPVRRVVGGWQEVLDLAVDLRRPVDPVATRREAAAALARSFSDEDEPVTTTRPRRGLRGRGRPDASSQQPARPAAQPRSRRGRGRRGTPPDVAGAVRVLAEQADAVVFGAAEPSVDQARAFWAQVDVALARMRATLSRRARWRGRVTTRSLRRSARRDRPTSTSTTSGTTTSRTSSRLPRPGARRRRAATKGQDR